MTAKYPHAELRTDGENVGLPDGQMGNSEVGHLNIGAGRVVFQELTRINRACDGKGVRISVPSQRLDSFGVDMAELVAGQKKGGLTFAPEAGTQRLRDVINKNVTQEDLLASCRTAFAGGYSAVKLYFMLGLPTETDEDVLGIADLAARVMHTWRESASNKNRGVRITVSTSWFVPKPNLSLIHISEPTRP